MCAGKTYCTVCVTPAGGAPSERHSGTTASAAPPVSWEAEQRWSVPHGLWLRKLSFLHYTFSAFEIFSLIETNLPKEMCENQWCNFIYRRMWKENISGMHLYHLHLFVSLQVFYLWIGKCCNEMFIRDVLGCPNYASVPANMVSKKKSDSWYFKMGSFFSLWINTLLQVFPWKWDTFASGLSSYCQWQHCRTDLLVQQT